MVFGFAGAGNMARAIARGWAKGEGGPTEMLFTDSGSGRADALAAEVGGGTRPSVPELVADCDAVLLAVKPNALEAVAADLRGARVVVSVLGATTVARLARALPGATVLRTMPNVAVAERRGVICHAPARAGEGDALRPVLELLGLLGELVELPEAQLDAATAVMGCAPAYFAHLAGALTDAGERAGLDRELAAELVARTAEGSGAVLATQDAVELERSVASPGGSTEAGLEALREHGTGAAVEAAVEASLKRMGACQ